MPVTDLEVAREAGEVARDADAAVTELYAAHYQMLVGLAALLVRDQGAAEELVQDSFVAMHSGWRRLREPDKALGYEPDKALGYLRRSVVSRSRSALRSRTAVARAAPPDAPSAGQHPLALLADSAMVAALDRLPGRQREALVLRYYGELSPAQVALAMGISPSSVNGLTARALSSLSGMVALRA